MKPVSITSVIPNVMRWLLAFSMGYTTDTNNSFFCKVKYDLVIEAIWGRVIVICFITWLIPATSPVISEADPEQIPTKALSSKICQNWWVIEHIKSPQKSEHGNMLKFSKTLRSPLHITWTWLKKKGKFTSSVSFYRMCLIAACSQRGSTTDTYKSFSSQWKDRQLTHFRPSNRFRTVKYFVLFISCL